MRILIIVLSVCFSDALYVRHVRPLPRKLFLSKPSSDESFGSLAKFAGDVTSVIKDIRAGPDLTVPGKRMIDYPSTWTRSVTNQPFYRIFS
jgi:hypothetical protein